MPDRYSILLGKKSPKPENPWNSKEKKEPPVTKRKRSIDFSYAYSKLYGQPQTVSQNIKRVIEEDDLVVTGAPEHKDVDVLGLLNSTGHQCPHCHRLIVMVQDTGRGVAACPYCRSNFRI